MKLASFIQNGRASFGQVEGEIIKDLNPDDSFTSLKDALSGPRPIQDLEYGATYKLSEIDFLPVIPDPQKIFCIGLNYRDHSAETGIAVPDNPSVFVRFPDSVVGHGQSIIRPKVSYAFDFEGELAVIIGRTARYVSEEDALSYVAGYSCFAENSIRDFQFHSRQAIPGKSFWKTGGFGPWMVLADRAPKPDAFELTTRLNGEIMQTGHTRDMIFPVATLIAYISKFSPLAPGDVIATGTPSGVGFSREPKVYMKAGDTLEVEISSIGTLSHGVIDEDTD